MHTSSTPRRFERQESVSVVVKRTLADAEESINYQIESLHLQSGSLSKTDDDEDCSISFEIQNLLSYQDELRDELLEIELHWRGLDYKKLDWKMQGDEDYGDIEHLQATGDIEHLQANIIAERSNGIFSLERELVAGSSVPDLVSLSSFSAGSTYSDLSLGSGHESSSVTSNPTSTSSPDSPSTGACLENSVRGVTLGLISERLVASQAKTQKPTILHGWLNQQLLLVPRREHKLFSPGSLLGAVPILGSASKEGHVLVMGGSFFTNCHSRREDGIAAIDEIEED